MRRTSDACINLVQVGCTFEAVPRNIAQVILPPILDWPMQTWMSGEWAGETQSRVDRGRRWCSVRHKLRIRRRTVRRFGVARLLLPQQATHVLSSPPPFPSCTDWHSTKHTDTRKPTSATTQGSAKGHQLSLLESSTPPCTTELTMSSLKGCSTCNRNRGIDLVIKVSCVKLVPTRSSPHSSMEILHFTCKN